MSQGAADKENTMMRLTDSEKARAKKAAAMDEIISGMMKGQWYYVGRNDTRTESFDGGSVDGEYHHCDVCGRKHAVLHVFRKLNGTEEVICGGGCATAAKRKAMSKTAYYRRINRQQWSMQC